MTLADRLPRLTRRVPARWQERVAKVGSRYVLIWNPIMGCHAILAKGLADQRVEFDGYGYQGWTYLMSCTDAAGRPRPLDQRFIEELADRTKYARETTRRQLDIRLRESFRLQGEARKKDVELEIDAAWAESKDIFERHLTRRKSVGGFGRKTG